MQNCCSQIQILYWLIKVKMQGGLFFVFCFSSLGRGCLCKTHTGVDGQLVITWLHNICLVLLWHIQLTLIILIQEYTGYMHQCPSSCTGLWYMLHSTIAGQCDVYGITVWLVAYTQFTSMS